MKKNGLEIAVSEGDAGFSRLSDKVTGLNAVNDACIHFFNRRGMVRKDIRGNIVENPLAGLRRKGAKK